eukprot:1077211-Pleurochrysis_carterae.AAC.2
MANRLWRDETSSATRCARSTLSAVASEASDDSGDFSVSSQKSALCGASRHGVPSQLSTAGGEAGSCLNAVKSERYASAGESTSIDGAWKSGNFFLMASISLREI